MQTQLNRHTHTHTTHRDKAVCRHSSIDKHTQHRDKAVCRHSSDSLTILALASACVMPLGVSTEVSELPCTRLSAFHVLWPCLYVRDMRSTMSCVKGLYDDEALIVFVGMLFCIITSTSTLLSTAQHAHSFMYFNIKMVHTCAALHHICSAHARVSLACLLCH